MAVGDGGGPAATFPLATSPGIVVTAWIIRDGQVNDVDVSGLAVVVLVDRHGAETRRLLLVDDRADPEQLRWLLDAFQGRLSGPLGDLARAVTEDLGFYHLPVCCELLEERQSLAIPLRLMATLAGVPEDEVGSDRPQPYSWSAGGSWWPAGRSRASAGWMRFPEHGLERDLAGCTGLRGRFRVETCTS